MVSTAKSQKERYLRRPTPESDLGFSWGPVNSLLLGLAVTVLAVGYITLARQSLTLAPVLLILGYCVLVPASLMWRGGARKEGE